MNQTAEQVIIIDNTYRMFSGHAEQQKHKYHKYEGKKGTWYVADVPNKGDNVYCHIPGNEEGFGGSKMDFPLVNGEIDLVKGPWHSNSEALLHDTGIDYTELHFTKGVICRIIHYKSCNLICIGVLHNDEDWTLGKFNRISSLAEIKAKEEGCQLRYHSVSKGGSSTGYTQYGR